MREQPPGVVLLVMLGLGLGYVLAGVGYNVLLGGGRSSAFKRKWHSRCSAFVGAYVLASIFILASISPAFRIGRQSSLRFLIPFGSMAAIVTFLTFMSVPSTWFCDSCGASFTPGSSGLHNLSGWKYCHDCGTKMEPIPKPRSFWSLSFSRSRSTCPGCGNRYPPSGSHWTRAYHFCPECGAKSPNRPKAIGKKKGRDGLLD